MNRRGFLGALLAGAVLDPEELLWRPGRLISIPAYRRYPFRIYPAMSFDTAQAEVIERIMNHRYATDPAFRGRLLRETPRYLMDSIIDETYDLRPLA